MTWYQIYHDESAVSSVISVILLVAITVILAAVVATFALGITDSATSEVPEASFDIEQGTMTINATGGRYADFYVVTITHAGGDEIHTEQLRLTVNGEKAWGVVAANDCGNDCDRATTLWGGSSTVSSGSSVTVVHTDDPDITDGKGYTIDTQGGYQPNVRADPSENILVANGDSSGNSDAHIDLDVGDTVRVIWESDRSDETAVLAEHVVTE